MSDKMTDSKSMMADRTSRYDHLITPEKLLEAHVAIIGTGAIGRAVALQLAAIGVGRLTLVDFDKVEAVNLGAQGWKPEQMGQPKVQALAADLKAINPDMHPYWFDEKFDPKHIEDIPFVFSCVDSMEVRREILGCAMANIGLRLFGESRMAAESFHCYGVTGKAAADAWLADWYPSSEAAVEGCTTKSTIYCASAAASVLVGMFRKAVMNFTVPYHIFFNMQAFEGQTDWTPPQPEEEQASEPAPETMGKPGTRVLGVGAD